MKKIDALKSVNNILINRINEYNSKLKPKSSNINSHNFSDFLVNHKINKETTCDYYKINKHIKSDVMGGDIFTRIVCISGKIKIFIPYYNDETILESLNTLLIIPNSSYSIETLEDSQIILIHKSENHTINNKIAEENTIYNKL